MGQLGDVLHVSFTIWPEWNPTELLHPAAIHIDVVKSHQICQFVGWSDIIECMMAMVCNDLGLPHIMQFSTMFHLALGTSWIQ
jgi:histidinol-phosphate/aromatic aminotransferase/cobyric acid decarboxylase-like protein